MDVLKRLEELMKIESHEGVSEITAHLIDEIDNAWVDETGCICAEKEGEEDGPEIVLNSHMDVVSPHIKFKREEDTIYGRGACDAKGCLVPMIDAFLNVEPEAGVLKLIISPDEETTHEGLENYLSNGISGDLAIVGEPSGLDVCTSARGHYDLLVKLYGESAHGSTPDSGVNATEYAAEAITRITEIPQLEDEELGTNSFTPTIVSGGNRPNQVPEYTEFVVDYRTIPEETQEDAIERIEIVLKSLSCEYDIELYESGASLGAFKTGRDCELAIELRDMVRAVTETESDLRPFTAATEAAVFDPHMPVVVFGPGMISDGERPIAHSEHEFVPVNEVTGAAEVLKQFLTNVHSHREEPADARN